MLKSDMCNNLVQSNILEKDISINQQFYPKVYFLDQTLIHVHQTTWRRRFIVMLLSQRNQRSNCQHPLDHRKSKRIPEKTSTSASLTTLRPLTVWITTNWKILKETVVTGHLTCLLRKLYAGQEATVRTGHGTTDWFRIEKEACQGCILSPCLFNIYHVKCQAGWIINWNQDCSEKYQ